MYKAMGAWANYQAKQRQERARAIKQALVGALAVVVGAVIGVAFLYVVFLDVLTIAGR